LPELENECDFLAPHQRTNLVGHARADARIAGLIADGALSNGWLITGGQGIGKATLAYRIARAVLSGSKADTLQIDPRTGDKTFALIAGLAHPDLFVAQRRWDEKKDRFETEISVETIRKLTGFLNRTASMGGWRVAIIDSADALNRNAANALLKSLEEPPARSVLLLASSAPGRLIATIRSRCRRIDLREVGDDDIAGFLAAEGVAEGKEAIKIAGVARGRPGFALSLAMSEGADAAQAVDLFLSGAMHHGDASAAAKHLVGKSADARWSIFKTLLIDALTDGARARAMAAPCDDVFANAAAGQLAAARDELNSLLTRGEALNLDRMQLIMAMGRRLHGAIGNQAA